VEKPELEKTSALKLLACLTEETRLMVYRDLNRAREDRFAGKLEDLSMQDRARLKLLKAIRKEQGEQREQRARDKTEYSLG
jgi:hypothetical protein